VIGASGTQPPPPFVVVQGKYIMADWFSPNMDPDLRSGTTSFGREMGIVRGGTCIRAGWTSIAVIYLQSLIAANEKKRTAC
jgi:hypothetical protein